MESDAKAIAAAKQAYARHPLFSTIVHEHDDCIRIAYAWLAAQRRLKIPQRESYLPLKHIIEKWAGRYISTDDVEVAAILLGLRGHYPHYNISKRRIDPPTTLLDGIGQAFTQMNYCKRGQ